MADDNIPKGGFKVKFPFSLYQPFDGKPFGIDFSVVGSDMSFSVYSNKSPGWQSSALQMDSSVLNRMAFAFPVLRMERLASVRSTLSESSFNDIFRLAIMTSKFTVIGITYIVKSFSD